MLSIYDDLTPGNNDLDQFEVVDSTEMYVISRTWVTTFRKYVEKSVSDMSKKSLDEACGGIDLLDLNAVAGRDEAISSFKGEDPTSKITCEYFKFCVVMYDLLIFTKIPYHIFSI